LRLPGAASAVFSPGWTLTGVCQRDTHFSLGGGMAGKDSRHGKCKPGLARLATASSLDTAKVSALQFSEIQTSGVAPV
jgi:hypothetical protein